MKKKSFLVALTIAIMIFMIGCTRVDIGTQSTITKEGLITTKLVVSYASQEGDKNTTGSFIKEVVSNSEIEVQKYFKDGRYYEEAKGEAIDISTYSDRYYSFNDILLYSYNKEKGLLKDTINISIKVDPLVINNEKISKNKSNIYYVNEVTLPGEIISTNAQEQSESTVKWSIKMDQVDENTNMIASYTFVNYTNMIILTIVGGILIGSIIYIFIRKRKIK